MAAKKRTRPALKGAVVQGDTITFPLTLENMRAYMTIVTAAERPKGSRGRQK